ncbi:Cytochrome P450 704C1 (Cytochrome P450 CYPD), partial [Durusdinium trenchii]
MRHHPAVAAPSRPESCLQASRPSPAQPQRPSERERSVAAGVNERATGTCGSRQRSTILAVIIIIIMGTVLAKLRERRVTLRGALKAYVVFAVCHSLFKLVRKFLELREFKRLTAHIPPGGDLDLVGKGIKANVHRVHDWIAEGLLPYPGKPLVRRASPEMMVVANTPESVKFLLEDNFKQFTKPRKEDDHMFELLAQFIGNGIFVLPHGDAATPAQHEKWRMQRKTASLIFTKSNFSSAMHQTFVDKSEKLVGMLRAVAEANEGKTSNLRAEGARTVDMQERFFCFTMDSIKKIFFGEEVDTVLGDEDPYAQAFDKAHRSMLRFLVQQIPVMLLSKFVLPFPFGELRRETVGRGWAMKIFRMFNAEYAAFREHTKFLQSETLARVRELRTDPSVATRKDLISNFINASRKLPAAQQLSDQDMCDLVLNFIIAGRDTTACLLSWMFFEFATNPEVQEEAAREIDAVLQGRVPTVDDLRELPYLQGCVLEALRLHPPVPFDTKIASDYVTFPDGTTVPPRCRVGFAPFAIGRDPAQFPDPLVFNPKRWDPSNRSIFTSPKTNFAFPVFQAGYRYCLGAEMAHVEASILTCMLLRKDPSSGKALRFDLEGSQAPEDITYALSITMSILNRATDKHELHLAGLGRVEITVRAAAEHQ